MTSSTKSPKIVKDVLWAQVAHVVDLELLVMFTKSYIQVKLAHANHLAIDNYVTTDVQL